MNAILSLFDAIVIYRINSNFDLNKYVKDLDLNNILNWYGSLGHRLLHKLYISFIRSLILQKKRYGIVNTFMHLVFVNEHIKIIKLFLNDIDASYDIDIYGIYDIIFDYVIFHTNEKIIKLFLNDIRFDLSIDNNCILRFACKNSNPHSINIIKLLLSDPKIIGNDECLYNVIRNNQMDNIKLLLNHQNGIYSSSEIIKSIKNACRNKNIEIIKLLITYDGNSGLLTDDPIVKCIIEYVNNHQHL